jgi:hypothetical protein
VYRGKTVGLSTKNQVHVDKKPSPRDKSHCYSVLHLEY